MQHKYINGLIIVALALAGCGGKQAGAGDAGSSAASDKTSEQAKAQPGAEQKVADLEKQLADAKKELAQEKSAPASPAAPGRPTPAPQPREVVIPAGTPVSVRTTTTLSTKTAANGTPFSASLTKPLTVDGVVLADRGADVSGVVVRSDPGGRVKGKASISVALTSIRGTHGPIAIATDARGAVARGTVKKDFVRGGIMSGAGAVIGAIAGGGKGAAIGAGVGAGAGAGTAMATRGAAAQIPAETVLTFKTKAPVTVTVGPSPE